ncbi:MAG: glycoside hydrolase family 3 protein [Lachnospiraceae bacterium]|nr:glycoside hydrolase family 3 protein [Lachnospiraceae bacterium]
MGNKNRNKRCIYRVTAMVLCGILLTLTSCTLPGRGEKNYTRYTPPAEESPAVSEAPVITLSKEEATDFAKRYLQQMSLEEKVAQLFVVKLEELDTSEGGYYEFKKCTKGMKETLAKIPVSGVILFSRNISNPKKTKKMIERLQLSSKTPLFVAVDEEGGSVARVATNKKMKTTVFPSAESIGKSKDGDYVYDMGRTIAREIRSFGFNVDFAPVADVKTSDLNTEIGDRSFGSDPQKVSELVSAFVQGCQERGVCATLKHFPGQGASVGDTHQESVDIDSSISKLRGLDFVPFEAGIHAGAEFIMVSHISVSRVTETKEPASMSELVMKTILREELNFEGIVITDAFDMASVTEYYTPAEAALNAVKGGADIVLMPNDLEQAYNAVLDAVKSDSIPQSRLDESVTRILITKFRRGIITEEQLTAVENPTPKPSPTSTPKKSKKTPKKTPKDE